MEFATTSMGALNNANVRNVTASTSAVNIFAPANVTQMRQLGTVMLTKIPQHNRQQTVILQPRPATIGSNKPTLPIRVPTAVISQNVCPSSSGISIRTRLVGPNQHGNALPVLNLSQNTSSSITSVNNVKQIVSAHKLVSSETVNLVVTTDRNLKASVPPGEIKTTSMLTVQPMQNLTKVNKLLPNSGANIVTAQSKVISINSAVVPRMELINNKSGTINNQAKTFIISTPSTSSGGEAFVVNPSMSFSANKISMTPNAHIITSRGQVTPSNVYVSTQITNSVKPTIYTVSPTGANIFNQTAIVNTSVTFQQRIGTTASTVFSTAPALNPQALTLPINASNQLQSKPKAKILSRKRFSNDGPLSRTPNGSVSSHISSNLIEIQRSAYIPRNEISVDNVLDVSSPVFASFDIISNQFNHIPKKKPKKQLLERSIPSESDADGKLTVRENGIIETNIVNDQTLRPFLFTHSHSQYQFKSCQHFMRYSDVKSRPEKRVPISERVKEVEKASKENLKFDRLMSQIEDGSKEESATKQQFMGFLEFLETEISPHSKLAAMSTLFGNPEEAQKLNYVDRYCMKINDLTRGIIQRSELIIENYKDTSQSIIDLSNDHKEKVSAITRKITNKRGFIK